jgi:hypothetical protein
MAHNGLKSILTGHSYFDFSTAHRSMKCSF